MASSSPHHSYSRKQKSLGLLCTKFLGIYNKQGVQLISLDDAALQLGVERRRIYDIVNILESVGVLARKAKNQYTWKGFSAIPEALKLLKDEGLKENSASFDGSKNSVKISNDMEDKETFSNHSSGSQDDKLNPGGTALAPVKSSKNENRREKSLALLTQSFVKLFVCCNIPMISLEEAAKLLLGNDHDTKIMRTRVRRLYDIANVLSSTKLIEKTHTTDTRKPAFRWLGFRGKTCSESDDKAHNSNMNVSGKRMFGNDITNISSKRNKVDLFMDDHNFKMQKEKEDENISCGVQPEKSNLEKDAEQSSKSYQFGPFAKDAEQSSKSYQFGPFDPAECVPKVGNSENNSVKQVHDWESLSQVHRPYYQNQAVKDLFSHYMEAWKSWYSEIARKISMK